MVMLAQDMSDRYDIPLATIADSFAAVPDDLLYLFDLPRGQSVLVEFVADDRGIKLPAYWPRLH